MVDFHQKLESTQRCDNTKSKTEAIPINNSEEKRNDEVDTEVLLIDLDEEDDESTMDINSKYSPGVSKSSSSSYASDNKIEISSPSKADYLKEKSSGEKGNSI